MANEMHRAWRRLACLLLCVGVYCSASGLLQLHEVFFQPAVPRQKLNGSSNQPLKPVHPTRQYDRLVVVLIDALRADMVLGSQALYGAAGGTAHNQELNQHMQFTRSLFTRGVAAGFVAHASVPTVTMPRLKALLSGKPPAFIDILKNFNAAALEEENLIQLFREQGNRIVFYGDDTWLKLFPDAFQRHEATSGFYTRDTVEVDDNVTRHLKDELDPTMQHPQSRDWDVLVLHYLGLDHVGHLRGPRSSLMKSKLHEMDDVVKRVYESVREQDTLRAKEAKQRGGLFKPSLIVLCSDHGMSEIGNHGGATVEESSALMAFVRGDQRPLGDEVSASTATRRLQVDLVPTLTSLFGLRIPTYSTGLVLDAIIQRSTSESEDPEAQLIMALYANLLQLRTLLSIKFPVHLKKLATEELEQRTLDRLRDSAAATRQADARLIDELRAMCVKLQQRVAASDGSEYNVTLTGAGIITLLAVAIGAFAVVLQRTPLAPVRASGPASLVAVMSFVLTIVSLTSTSSIENEHATMFFLLTTLLVAMLLDGVRRRSSDHRQVALLLLCVACVRLLRERSQVINFARLNHLEVDTSQPGNEFAMDNSLSVWFTGPLLNSLRLPRGVYLTIIFGMLTVSKTRLDVKAVGQTSVAQWCLTVVGAVANWWCASLVEADAASASIDVAARLVYACAVLLLVVGFTTRSRACCGELALWLVMCVVQKASNLPTLAVLSVLLQSLGVLYRLGAFKSSWLVSEAVTLWLAWASFFALGNSHLVTTIDISQAYHGLRGYSQSIVGLLTFINVCSGPLATLVCSLQWRPTDGAHARASPWILVGYQALRAAVYAIVVFFMRFHLFIWSVFAPKMLYEVVFSFTVALFSTV